jgi:hypothetical protein
MKYQKPAIELLASAEVGIRSSGQHVKPIGRYLDSPLQNSFTVNAYEADE